ncbi:MAG: bifunctional folylpolyglutamate synthase/dihydrofolate synthase [Thermoplasmata archaeon]
MEDLEYLYSLSRYGVKLELSTMQNLVSELQNPQLSFKSFHVTGTNGKGSTCTMLYSILKNRYRAGLYTSPHILNFNERVMAMDHFIENSYMSNWIKGKKPVIEKFAKEGSQPTFFEVTTAMAFDYFKSKNVEYAVIEVGMGGRLDATNIIVPETAGITSISFDHTDKLGNTLTDIAREKGGIIKSKKPVVFGQIAPEPLETLKKIAKDKGAPYFSIGELYKPKQVEISESGTSFYVEGMKENYNITISVPGEYQMKNALVSLGMLEFSSVDISRDDIETGFRNFRINGRFEIKSRSPLIIFDVAHNPGAAEVLVDTIKRFYRKEPLLLVTQLKDKNSLEFLKVLSKISQSVIVTEVKDIRKKDVELLKEEAKKFFKNVYAFKDPVEAYKFAIGSSDFIVVTGSFYLLGELEEWMKKERY